MTFDEAVALVNALPLDQRIAIAVVTKHIVDKNMVKAYELGVEHGEKGTRVSYEFLFKMLDPS